MASMKFENVYIKGYYTLVGPKEKNSKIAHFDYALDDYYFMSKTFEQAEIKMQRVVIENILKENKLSFDKIDYLLGGDLVNQIAITSYNAKDFAIPFIGLYAACATFPLSLVLGANLIESGSANKVLCVTSSHNLTAERQFRYPVEYGNSKPNTATCTATGAVSTILGKEKTKLKIISATLGKPVDLGVSDVNNMGAVMAPACADTLYRHLRNFKQKSADYDLILTGDLGSTGIEILKDYYEKSYKERLNNVIDAGASMYLKSQDMYAGGSGPVCLPLVLFGNIIESKRYKKILILGTGSLHNPALVNQKQSIPAICHAVGIEVLS